MQKTALTEYPTTRILIDLGPCIMKLLTGYYSQAISSLYAVIGASSEKGAGVDRW